MFDVKTKELIAVAASVVAKCQPCLDFHVGAARTAGAPDSEIRAAIKIAQSIRGVGDDYMDKFAEQQFSKNNEPDTGGCGCGCNCQ